MADEKIKYRYTGPPIFVVESQTYLEDGDTIVGSAALGCAAGFTRESAASKKSGAEKGADD